MITEPISVVMSANPVTLHADGLVSEARQVFIDNGFLIAPIVDREGRLVGLVSATDLVDWEDPDAYPWLIQDVMSTDVITERLDVTVAQAARRLSDGEVHHLIVVDEGRHPVGVVSGLDIVSALGDTDLTQPVGEIMSESRLTLTLDSTIAEAHASMVEAGLQTAPVVDENGSLLGAVDLIGLMMDDAAGGDGSERVDDFMKPAVVVLEDELVCNVAQIMIEANARQVFVEDENGEIVGIIATTDLVHYVAGLDEEDQPEDEDDIIEQPAGTDF